jgi:hypothetical protein
MIESTIEPEPRKEHKPVNVVSPKLYYFLMGLIMGWSVLVGVGSTMFFLVHGSRLMAFGLLMTLPVLWVAMVQTIKGELE